MKLLGSTTLTKAEEAVGKASDEAAGLNRDATAPNPTPAKKRTAVFTGAIAEATRF